MRVVAGRNGATSRGQHSQQAEIELHTEALTRLAGKAGRPELDAPVCTMVLRSAKSAPARALTQMREALAGSGIVVKAIVTQVDPELELHALFAALSELVPDGDLDAHVRWARNPRLMDAHEQAVYGPDLCWTGDAVRRDADKHNRLVLFETCPDAILRGNRAFRALWAVSEPVPAHLLDIRGANGPLAAEACTKEAPLTALTPLGEGWPLLRN